MKKLLLVLLVLVVFFVLAFYFFKQARVVETSKSQEEPASLNTNPNTNTPFTASFEIYTLGTKRDFSDKKYHSTSVEAYIESTPPYNMVVNKDGITWQEFFDTLPSPFKITPECLYTGTGQEFCNSETAKLNFFINGSQESNALSKPILESHLLIIRYE